MKINKVKRKDIIDKLLDNIFKKEPISDEMMNMLIDLSKSN